MISKIKCKKAATMVEFALVIPLLLFLILLIVDFSIYFFVKNSIDHASKMAATLATTMPGIDRFGIDDSGVPNNQQSVNDLFKKFQDENTEKPILPTLLVSTGLIEDFTIQFNGPPGWKDDPDAYRKNPFEIKIIAKYKGLIPFLPFVPKDIESDGKAYREYQENSTLPLPVDCLGHPIFPDSPPVPPSLCPCDSSGDPMKRALPGQEGKCSCPFSALMGCYVGNQLHCTNIAAACECPPEGQCRCLDTQNMEFNSNTGKCECKPGRSYDSDSGKCECNACPSGSITDANSCTCQSCPNNCPNGTIRKSDSCDCECNPYKIDTNKIIQVGGVCQCDPVEKDKCLETEGTVFYGMGVRSDNKLGGCYCVTCDELSNKDNNTYYNPNPTKNGCQCDIKPGEPGGLEAYCKSQNLEVDVTNCSCRPNCTVDQYRTENCTCKLTSEICNANGQGNADPTKCRCRGECEFTAPPPGITPVPIPASNCNCDRNKLAELCSGNANDHSKNHPFYCTCLCKDPGNPANCSGPCDPYVWTNHCANSPVGDPLGLPFDWNLYNSTNKIVCACASGQCKGDTILDPASGQCICDPAKIAQFQNCTAPLGEQKFVQTILSDGSIECSCKASCEGLQTERNKTCVCIEGNTPEEKAASLKAKVDYCKGLNPPTAFNPATCSCGSACQFPFSIDVSGKCICDISNFFNLPEYIAAINQCQTNNAILNTGTCSCGTVCPANQISQKFYCAACPNGEVSLFCQATQRWSCAPASCVGNAACTCSSTGFYNPGSGENHINP